MSRNSTHCSRRLPSTRLGELSLEGLSQDSGVTKPTLKRYLEYLEAAFLIKVVHRIDHNARRFKRATRFKVYVTTPALRSALFGPVNGGRRCDGSHWPKPRSFAQWVHASVDLHYARWRMGQTEGEVDIVRLDKRQKPVWCLDVKWSDRPGRTPGRALTSLADFAKPSRRLPRSSSPPEPSSRSVSSQWRGPGSLNVIPTSLYCYAVGRDVVRDPSFVHHSGRPSADLRQPQRVSLHRTDLRAERSAGLDNMLSGTPHRERRCQSPSMGDLLERFDGES